MPEPAPWSSDSDEKVGGTEPCDAAEPESEAEWAELGPAAGGSPFPSKAGVSGPPLCPAEDPPFGLRGPSRPTPLSWLLWAHQRHDITWALWSGYDQESWGVWVSASVGCYSRHVIGWVVGSGRSAPAAMLGGQLRGDHRRGDTHETLGDLGRNCSSMWSRPRRLNRIWVRFGLIPTKPGLPSTDLGLTSSNLGLVPAKARVASSGVDQLWTGSPHLVCGFDHSLVDTQSLAARSRRSVRGFDQRVGGFGRVSPVGGDRWG